MTAREEAGLEGAWAVVSRSLQGEAGACGGDHGRIQTALSHRCAHAIRMPRERARTVRSLKW